MPKALVVGYGSIGARHARLLEKLGVQVGVVSRRSIDVSCAYSCLEDALSTTDFDLVVVANETNMHWPTLIALASSSFKGRVLVEKPLNATVPDGGDLARLADLKARTWVAYNLRLHPGLQRLHEVLRTTRVMNMNIYVGQDLATWRPGRDLAASYSTAKAAGGGVLRDLSHELDYINWLVGPWTDVVADCGHYGSNGYDVEDAASIILRSANCPNISLQMDYFDRPGARLIRVNSDAGTFTLDLVKGVWSDGQNSETLETPRDFTYEEQLKALLGGDTRHLANFDQGLAVVTLISAIEKSSQDKAWVRA
jgi:predicted dehydrogenase